MSSLVTDISSGQKIGSYSSTHLLGRSALSEVYAVQQENTQQSYILTMFIISDAFPMQTRQRFLARFARDSAVLMKLHHPYILPVQDAGEYMGRPYLVNPAVQGSSVATLLKQKGRLTAKQTLELLKRVADSIDHAHSKGIVHGTLSPTNILLNSTMQIAGFGLLNTLTIYGLEDIGQSPQPALRSIAGTTLGTPGYIAPEVIQGRAFDGRIDVYSLGALALQLLSGLPPESEPSMHVPNVRRFATLCPELSLELGDVLQKALHHDPAQRIQSAGAFVTLFAQALEDQQPTAPQPATTAKGVYDSQVTLPNAVDWFVKESTLSQKWQLIPQATAQIAAVHPKEIREAGIVENGDTLETIDPFVWWSSMSAAQIADHTPGTLAKTPQQRPVSKKRAVAQRQKRRRVVAMLASGGVVALGALGFGGVTLAHVLRQPQLTTPNKVVSVQTTPAGGAAKPKATVQPKQTKPTPGITSKPTKKPITTSTQPPSPTQPTSPTPTPMPSHTGTVISSTNMSINASQNFINPANGNGSILVHLLNGNFVAYSRACSHEGVSVNYDSRSQKLICPRHGAIFDPANGGSPVSGPNNGPLQGVMIRVNGDGTITTG